MYRSVAAAAVVIATTTVASAFGDGPVFSVDLDPSTPGIQSTHRVDPFASFEIDVFLSLDGFSAGSHSTVLSFDPSQVSNPDVGTFTDGGFGFPFAISVNPSLGRFSFNDVDPFGTTTDGIIGRFSFDALAGGVATFGLDQRDSVDRSTSLFDTSASPLPFSTEGAVLTIGPDMSAVPLPAGLPLLGLGLAGFWALRRRG